MKRTFLSVVGVVAATALASQVGLSQATSAPPIRVRGCLQGDGSEAKPWVLAGAVLPPPPSAAPAAAPGGGGGGRGAAGGRGAGQAAGGAPTAGRGADGGARGAGGGRGAAPAPAPPRPPVDLRLSGLNLMPWWGMRVEVEGTLGARPATGLQEFQVTSARSVWGACSAR